MVTDRLSEADQILIPVDSGYRAYSLMLLFGDGRHMLRETSGFGLPPLHYLTQRGPFQDGESPLDLRFNPRTIQIMIAEQLPNRSTYWERRNDILDLLRPNRSFSDTVTPLVYRKWLPGGQMERGSDMSVTNGSATVTSRYGRFIHLGGLEAGRKITIGGVDYTISSVPNDYTLILTTAYASSTASNVSWSYRRGRSFRDLFVLLEQGPSFDQGPGPSPFYPTGYAEALRFVAHDPFFYGGPQSETWVIPDDIGDLVFDGNGAYFGQLSGSGRWAFVAGAVGESVSVTYWGTRRAPPTIRVDGPATDPSVENLTTGKRIAVQYDIIAGQSITINTLELTVVLNDGTNLLPYTTGDLATFGIEAAPQAPGGINEIEIAFSGGLVGVSAATLSYRNIYVGI